MTEGGGKQVTVSLYLKPRGLLPAIHGPFGLKYHPKDKAKAIAWKTSSHLMTSVTKTISGEWRLESKLCVKR